jgi:transposase
MWCIPKLTDEFKKRMEDVLELYAKPFNEKEPVVCFDEKSKQLLEDSRRGKEAIPGKIAIRDYEYVRKGTANIFVAIEPKAGKRLTEVTKQRTKKDYAKFLKKLIAKYPQAEVIHLVQDNLNTHSEKSLAIAFGQRKAEKMMRRLKFHFTPKHASWLNMAEIEIGVLSRQCLKRRIPKKTELQSEVLAWQKRSNKAKRTITWKFTTEKARKIFPSLYSTEFKG